MLCFALLMGVVQFAGFSGGLGILNLIGKKMPEAAAKVDGPISSIPFVNFLIEGIGIPAFENIFLVASIWGLLRMCLGRNPSLWLWVGLQVTIWGLTHQLIICVAGWKMTFLDSLPLGLVWGIPGVCIGFVYYKAIKRGFGGGAAYLWSVVPHAVVNSLGMTAQALGLLKQS